jgi:hydroxylamine reductase (hybrid-cluster protein)
MNRDVQSVDFSTENGGPSSIINSNLLNKNSWEIIRESIDLFFKSLKLGRVRGVAGVVDFPTSGSGNDSGYIQLAQELINRDILVIISGCGNVDMNRAGMTGADFFQKAGDGLAEFCEFIGIHPVLYTDSAIAGSDILDLYNGLAQHAEVAVSDLPAAAITQGRYPVQTGSSGTFFTMEDDPVKTADLVDEHIHYKRLGIQWCDRCDCRFSPFS